MVAGVLRDASGRILLAERPAGREHAGLWEFPGGKLEPGESAEQALRRELAEELGISIGATRPLICVPHAGGRRPLRLDALEVMGYDGTLHGREGQAIRWTPIDQLDRWPMPPADRPVVAALTAPALYPISPEPTDRDACLRDVEGLLARGIRRLQLRAKHGTDADLAPLVAELLQRTRAVGATLLLNGRIALAQQLGCGVHLTEAQLRGCARRPLPAESPVAASCHDLDALRRAEALGCDFAVLGPVRPTASHPGAGTLGWNGFAALREQVALPIYALGGLTAADLAVARAHGAQGIAAIRGLWFDTDERGGAAAAVEADDLVEMPRPD